MKITNLGVFLHFYQPPFQKKEVLDRVSREAYIPVIEGLIHHPSVRITLNISGCLLSMWAKSGYEDLLVKIRTLALSGRVELTGSSAYHAFLPKLPDAQIIRQIKLHEDLVYKYLSKDIQLRGFFPPEMAFVPHLSKLVQEMGYQWIALDERSKRGVPVHHRNYADKRGMRYVFRHRDLSYALAAGKIQSAKHLLKSIEKPRTCDDLCDGYTVIALDGETFGHHRKGYEKFLEELYRSPEVKLYTLSELLQKDHDTSVISPRKSSWTILDRKRSISTPFVRWADSTNEIHTMQWKLTRLACAIPHDERSQKLLDKALFSCQYWWACAKPWWHIEMIEAGAYALLQSTISSPATATKKKFAVDLYHDIVATSFEWMRTGKMQRLVNSEHEYLHYQGHKLETNQ